ncbi:hypothetical protein StrepF001_14185 [Streptomyces sp. F001]|uniref:hypothetical protein n=1 Tax=Streptomyces sp. F001 TaxID=1510026 RepID=UPI00101E8252|nr:hypothetical protein [Streptomyces sp. F001]RZB18263.1 hypothetical protein StrepF001_14185 [Streptomyces sp. F001]
MDSETAAAIIGARAGIIGAVVGGGSAVVAPRVTAAKGARATQEQWHRQSRRDAYAKLILIAQDVQEDIFRFRRDALEGQLTPYRALETYTRLTERMTEVRAARIAVEIEGPEDIDRYTGLVLRNLLRTVESLHPDVLLETDGRWSLPEAFEDGFARTGFAVSDLIWCAREILSRPGITSASQLHPPFHDYAT